MTKNPFKISFLQRQIPPFLNCFHKGDDNLDIADGGFEVGQLGLPGFEIASEGFELSS